MKKQDRLLKELGSLLSNYSAEDWRYASERISDIADLATDLSKRSNSNKKVASKKSRKGSASNAKPYSPNSELVSRFADFLRSSAIARNITNARKVAMAVGLKGDLPKTSKAIIDDVIRQLDTINDKSVQIARIEKAIEQIDDKGDQHASDYQRWVSLITKNRS